MVNMEYWRLFIACALPAPIRNALVQAQAELRQAGCALTYVRPEAMHLTLAFLGRGTPDGIPGIVACMQAAAQPCGALWLGQAGAFPSLTRPSVVWLGLGGATADLSKVYNMLQPGLHTLGCPPDRRVFTPHLTLGRVRREATAQQHGHIGLAVQTLRVEPLVWQPSQLCLYRSELLPTGPRYTLLAYVELAASPG